MVAAFNASSAAGRIICGVIADRIGHLNMLLLGFVLNTLSILVLWPVSRSLGVLALFAVVCGIGNGSFFALMSTTVQAVFGKEKHPVVMSHVVTGWLGGYLMVSRFVILLFYVPWGNLFPPGEFGSFVV
jgi:MFS family permease